MLYLRFTQRGRERLPKTDICSEDQYHRAVVDGHGLQGPGNTQPHQDVKDIAADGVRDRHIPQACRERRPANRGGHECPTEPNPTRFRMPVDEMSETCRVDTQVSGRRGEDAAPCRATMRLAMQSGTLVPAARKVMPMMTSGIPRVYPIIVTCI